MKIISSEIENRPDFLSDKLDAESLKQGLSKREYSEIKHATTAEGTQQYITAYLEGRGSVYDNSDSPLAGKIVTQGGLEAYSYDVGGSVKTVLKNGDTYSSYVCPSDMDGVELPEGSLNLEEIKALEFIHDEGNEIAFVDKVPGVDEMDRDGQLAAISQRIVKSREDILVLELPRKAPQ